MQVIFIVEGERRRRKAVQQLLHHSKPGTRLCLYARAYSDDA